ncbi:molybdopterin-dependent oxidoreductase [Luteolibacter pohnpeiensis]|uniref:Molybdopterin-dependent oxidoreductase n=1 Tax=Luteolibacter pohnpeiensis TaxID=454153 RepID=A0A934S6E2_9BACT|nr:molybdopterin-dependent oxidoreductase [Luteolibacter pohnpeiensis]MBK1881626.1 molybdopterin-dependent oxidoreductase [Luteolibacter pohnpeiensis]
MQRNSHSSRRDFIRRLAGAGLIAGTGGQLLRAAEVADVTLPFANGGRKLVQFPGKRPLILLTSRPPQLETPFGIFNDGLLTPNDAFYVRYHLAAIPLSIDPDQFRLEIKGVVKTPLSLSLQDLKTQFEQIETVAVAQCSGNSRGFSNPRVAGGQLGNGAMGNARWKGVRLKDVLEKAGLSAKAKQVSFDGLDTAVIDKTPDFVKPLDIEQIMAGEIMIAHTMNGEDLPMLNGFPLRLVVPGYYATYWVKHLHEVTVLEDEFEGFWMNPAYRIPTTGGGFIEPGTKPEATVPINSLNVRSFITSHADHDTLPVGKPTTIRGIAFDGGEGIKEVEFSADGGNSWRSAKLGEDLGRFSFREWTIPFTPSKKGTAHWKVRAFNRIGASQPMEPLWNPSGYMRNVVETVEVEIA